MNGRGRAPDRGARSEGSDAPVSTFFKRAHDLIEARANHALSAAERPDEMLDLSYEQMLEQLTNVRRALVDVAASKKRIELQEDQLRHSVDHLQQQATQALTAGREDLAHEALARKATAQTQIEQMEPQRAQIEDQEEKLSETLQTLQQRVNAFRTQKETLKASYTASQAMSSVNESVAGISRSLSDSGETLARAKDKIETMQAHASALDELLQSGVLEDVGSGKDDIQAELDQLGTSSRVDDELAALKASMQQRGELPAAGGPPTEEPPSA